MEGLILAPLALALALEGVAPVPADDAASLLKRAEAALADGAPREAADLFRKARKSDPAMAPEADWGLARAAWALGERKKALELASALAAGPAPPEKLAAVLMLKALALSGSGAPEDLEAAEAALRGAVDAAPSSPAPLYNLGVLQLKRGSTPDGLATLERCRAIAPESDLGRRAARVMRKPRLAGRNLAPDFTITSLSGQTLSLAGLEGKIVLLDFWATWCPPCRASVGELRDLRRKWPDDRLALVSVSVDEDEPAWRSFVAGHGMTWPQYRDADGRLTRAFRVSAFPTYVLLDGDGVEVRRITGMNERQTVGYRLQRELEAVREGR